MSVFGVVVCGISVGFFKRAALGVDPFQSLMSGLDALIPISFGTLYVIVNVCLLSFAFLNDKSKIGIATLINLFFLGYIADYSHKLLLTLFPELGMGGRLLMLFIAILIMCLSSSFYFTAALGVSPYDAISLIISEKWNFIPFKFCRIISDLCCVLLGSGMLLAAGKTPLQITEMVGIGTIITAFFMGPVIDWFNRNVAQKILHS